MSKSKFAFIGHVVSLEQFERLTWPGRICIGLPKKIKQKLLRCLPPMSLHFPEVRSLLEGKSVNGIGVICSLLPEDFVLIDERRIIQKIVRCIQLAKEKGANIATLGGFTSVVGDEGRVVSQQIDIPITSGNTYTVALITQSILRAVDLFELRPADLSVAVIGASGDLGIGCLKVLVKYFKKFRIAARNEKRLEFLASELSSTGRDFYVAKYVEDAISNANIILSVASALTTIVDPELLLPGAIVCDAAIPHSLSRELAQKRNDIFVYDGGIAKLWYPYSENLKTWYQMFKTTGIVGCLAEVMILALEGKLENYSLGRGNITPEKVQEIWSLGLRHGFDVGDYQSSGRRYSLEDIKSIKRSSMVYSADKEKRQISLAISRPEP